MLWTFLGLHCWPRLLVLVGYVLLDCIASLSLACMFITTYAVLSLAFPSILSGRNSLVEYCYSTDCGLLWTPKP